MWLLLFSQLAIAMPGTMKMPTQSSTHAKMVMGTMQHQPRMPSMASDCHHGSSKDPCGAPSNQHCTNMTACALCHATSTLASISLPTVYSPVRSELEWHSSHYASIFSPHLDRPPSLHACSS